MKHEEVIAQLLGAENAIRSLPDANHEEIKAAQSASQAAASLAEGLQRRTLQTNAALGQERAKTGAPSEAPEPQE